MDEQIDENRHRISGDAFNYATIACVVVVFFIAFFFVAEGDIPGFISVYAFALPGAIFISFTIAMIVSLLARKAIRGMVIVGEPTQKSSKTSAIALTIASVLILFICMAGSCSGNGSSSTYSSSNDSSLSEDEKDRRSAEEEASHYHYDDNGHIYDDRD